MSPAYFSTLRLGVHKTATSVWGSSFTEATTGYAWSSEGLLAPGERRTMPVNSKSGVFCTASSTYLPMFPYPMMAALIFCIRFNF
jgi:hypothetical protein